MEIVYVSGAGNVVADALSRWAYGAIEDPGDLTFDGSMNDHMQVQKWEEEDRKLDFAAATDLLATPVQILDVVENSVAVLWIFSMATCSIMDIHMDLPWDYGKDDAYMKLVDSIRAGNDEKGYWIYNGRLRHDHLTCVPTSMVMALVKALHGMQHAGPEKLLTLFGRQYECGLKTTALKDVIMLSRGENWTNFTSLKTPPRKLYMKPR